MWLYKKYLFTGDKEIENPDFNDIFYLPFRVLTILGVMNDAPRHFALFGKFGILIAEIVFNISQFFYLILYCRTIDEVSACYVMFICFLTALKIALFKREFKYIQDTIKTFNEKICMPKTDEQKEIMGKVVFIGVIFGTAIYAGSVMAITTFWFDIASEEPITQIVTPFDLTDPTYLLSCNLVIIFSLYFNALATCSIDLLNACFMAVITMELRFLNLNIESMSPHNKTNFAEMNVKEQCGYTLTQHYTILKGVNCLNRYVERLSFVQFLFSSVCIGCTIFRVLDGQQLHETILLVIAGSLLLTQLVIYCYLGSIVTDESIAIAESLYKCDWTEFPLTYRKNILIMMSRTQIPIAFTGMGIFSLSASTFVMLLRSAFSCYTLLSGMN